MEADRNPRTFETVWEGRTFNLIAARSGVSRILGQPGVVSVPHILLPPPMVTWIAMLSAESSLLEVAELDRERMMKSCRGWREKEGDLVERRREEPRRFVVR